MRGAILVVTPLGADLHVGFIVNRQPTSGSSTRPTAALTWFSFSTVETFGNRRFGSSRSRRHALTK
jgi:hypothetical protein